MKTLRLKDNSTIQIADDSRALVLIVPIASRNQLFSLWDQLSPENLSDFRVNGTRFEGYSLASVSIPVSNELRVHFNLSAPFTTREMQMQEQIARLTAENEALRDGAEAYDIITGVTE